MSLPQPSHLEVEPSAEPSSTSAPRGQFQFSLRALCVFIVVLAFLLALPGLIESLPGPWAIFVGVVYVFVASLVWIGFMIVTVIHVFAWLFSKRGESGAFGKPWLQLAAVALLTLTPIITAVAQNNWVRQLPNGYQAVSEEFGDYRWIANPQGRRIISLRVIQWQVNGDIVTGESADGSFFALDTATGEKCIAENADEIQQFLDSH